MKFLQLTIASLLLFFTAACSNSDKDETSLSDKYPELINLNSSVTGQNFKYQLPKTSAADYFRSNDEYVCTVDSNGLIRSACCGKTKVYVYTPKGISEIEVSVTPLYDTYTEPNNQWGASIAQMRNTLGSSYTMQASDTIAHLATKKYETKATQCDYAFEIAKGDTSLVATQLYIPLEYENEAAFFLLERYLLVNSTSHILLNGADEKKCTSIIQMTYYQDYAVITYYSFDYLYKQASGSLTTRTLASPWQLLNGKTPVLKSKFAK